MSRFLRFGLIVACVLLAPQAFADITIGHIVALSGPQASTGRELSVGAQAYIDKVNAEGGVAGHKIVYLVRDDAGLPEQTLARAGELFASEEVFGLLEGTNPAGVAALVQSGVLRQHSMPMLGIRGGVGSPGTLDGARQAGLVEIVPPQNYVAPLLDEFRQALGKYGPAGEPYSSAALQGYISAKVLVGAIRLLGPDPTRADFYTVIQMLIPDVSNHLAINAHLPPCAPGSSEDGCAAGLMATLPRPLAAPPSGPACSVSARRKKKGSPG